VKKELRIQSHEFIKSFLKDNDLLLGDSFQQTFDPTHQAEFNHYKKCVNSFLDMKLPWLGGYATLLKELNNPYNSEDVEAAAGVGDAGARQTLKRVRVAKLKLLDDLREAKVMNNASRRCLIAFGSLIAFLILIAGIFLPIYGLLQKK
jgi:hypothetical protein